MSPQNFQKSGIKFFGKVPLFWLADLRNNNDGEKAAYIERNVYNRVVYENQNIEEVWLFEKGIVRLIFKKTQGA
ncbi:hypothetical protein AGMMS49982_15200 [Bacteroidia bacterium]|nr:hypothetical protein AGMMS49982_15200 [Bacteroidia bacterium]